MSVVEWCACSGITKANYYYRLRRVRKACLESISQETFSQQIVPVEPALLQQLEIDFQTYIKFKSSNGISGIISVEVGEEADCCIFLSTEKI